MTGTTEIISYFRNGSRSCNAWVTMIDHQGKPNVSGFHDCDPTILVLNRDMLQLEYRADYYIYGQFMKFLPSGAVRVATSQSLGLPSNVAFKTPDGSLVLVVANFESKPREFAVGWGSNAFTAVLAEKSVATFRWAK